MPKKPILDAKAATALPIVVLWLFALTFLAILFLQDSIQYESLLLDPEIAATTPWYVGILWGFTILGWATASVAALGSGWICKLAGRTGPSTMLFRGGVLSLLYLANDLFQLGQRFAAFFNTSEALFAGGWIAASALWLFTERTELKRTRVELVATAIAALASAVAMTSIVPALLDIGKEQALVASSAAELLGVLAWAQYFVLTGADIVRSILMNLRAQSAKTQVDSPPAETRPVAAESAMAQSALTETVTTAASKGLAVNGLVTNPPSRTDLGQPSTAATLTPRDRSKKPAPT